MTITADGLWTEDAIRAHAAALYPMALRITRNVLDAEDLLQETFAKALAAWDRFEPGHQPERMAAPDHDQYVHQRLPEKPRSEPRFVPADFTSPQLLRVQSHDGSAEDQMLRYRLGADLTAALRALPDRYRVVVFLADLEGLATSRSPASPVSRSAA